MMESLWMRPALQKSEAVLMPAMQRQAVGERQFSDFYNHRQAAEDPFRPIVGDDMAITTALSTYVRPRGSMAGRSVLRAVGVASDPFSQRWARRTAGARRGATRRRTMYSMPPR